MRPGYPLAGVLLLPVILAACATSPPVATQPPERLFLQQVSAHSAIVKWRGGDARSVCIAADMNDLERNRGARCVDGVTTAGGHLEAQLTGLAPDRTYFYSLGGIVSDRQQFRTPPDGNRPPADGNTHILIIGDSGTATERAMLPPLGDGVTLQHPGEAAAVLAGFESYNAAHGNEPVDLFLALGDNAYNAGTDAQWQGAFFEIYPDILKGAQVLPTIGNHEMGYGGVPACALSPKLPCDTILTFPGTSISSNPATYDGTGNNVPDGAGMPYLDIFSLPTGSGTEQYYSVDYGNVHVVSLDSQLTARDETSRATMRAWLEDDLAGNTRDWTIVIFHHPPYTMGNNHNSDVANAGNGIDQPEWDIRNEFTPVFDKYGVDVVYSGHSHSYERSYYLHGLTGTSDTFGDNPQHAERIDGRLSLGQGKEAYAQLSPTSGGLDDRVVYTVAGSSGKADHPEQASEYRTVTPETWLMHSAHVPQPVSCDGPYGCRRGLPLKGSVVLDATARVLTARFIDVNGEVLDYFTITR